MSDRDQFHRLVDDLPDEHVAPMLALVRASMQVHPACAAEVPARRRRLSFAGLISAEPDLAERSEELLRDDFGPCEGSPQ
jgi:hypothetical protein